MSKATKKEIKDKKVEAYDLSHRIHAHLTQAKQLQIKLARIEGEINKLENKDGDT